MREGNKEWKIKKKEETRKGVKIKGNNDVRNV